MLKRGLKVSVKDPISKKKEKGVVVNEGNGFYEILLDSDRSIVVEKGEFVRFSLTILQDQKEVLVTDIKLTAKELAQKRKKVKSSNELWKSFERKVADFFGTERSALSGALATITNSDTLHLKVYVECKFRSIYSFWDKFIEERDSLLKSKVKTRLVWQICNLQKYSGGDLWLMYMDDFRECIGNQGVVFVESEEGQKRRIVSSNRYVIRQQNSYTGVLSLFKETEERAEFEGKLPVVALKMKNRKGYLLGTNPKYFEELNKVLNY